MLTLLKFKGIVWHFGQQAYRYFFVFALSIELKPGGISLA